MLLILMTQLIEFLLILFTVSLRPHLYFYQLEFDNIAAGPFLKFFSKEFGKWLS